jgi:type VI protein secretion system component Hcp
MKKRNGRTLAALVVSAATIGCSAAALSATGALAAGSGDFADFSMTNVRGDDNQLGTQRAVTDYHLTVNQRCKGSPRGSVCVPVFGPLTVHFPSISPSSVDLLKALSNRPLGRKAELDVGIRGSYCGFSIRQCMTYCLYDVQVTNVTHDGNKDGATSDRPVESATFGYGKIAYIYSDGQEAGTTNYPGGWDIDRGRSFTATSC